MIGEIKNLDKTKMFTQPEKKKITFLERLAIVFGYGKKG
jgi:hypothetical protein